MKKIIMSDQNKLRKEIYIVLISVCLFVGAIFYSEKYLSADEMTTKPTESEVRSKLEKLIDEGKITEYEAELKLEAILSGDKRWKKRGSFARQH